MSVLFDLATVTDSVLAVGDAAQIAASIYVEEGDGQWLKLIFLLSGPAYFMFMYARYRNKGARHYHEKETEAQITNLTGDDRKVRRITGTSSSSLSGANAHKVRGSRN